MKNVLNIMRFRDGAKNKGSNEKRNEITCLLRTNKPVNTIAVRRQKAREFMFNL